MAKVSRRDNFIGNEEIRMLQTRDEESADLMEFKKLK
jgi:hypothetical protein